MNPPVNQHYAPQVYLRRFSTDDGGIWVLDKRSGKIYLSGPARVGQAKHFYDLTDNDPESRGIFEAAFGRFEEDFACSSRALLEEAPQNGIRHKLLCHLAMFMAVQRLRTMSHRNEIREFVRTFNDSLVTRLMERNMPDRMEFAPTIEASERLIIYYQLRQVFEGSWVKIARLLEGYAWTFTINESATEFLTSDEPVHVISFAPKSDNTEYNIGGFGTQVVFPLSPKAALVLWDRRAHTAMATLHRATVTATEELVQLCNAATVLGSHRWVFAHAKSSLDFARRRVTVNEKKHSWKLISQQDLKELILYEDQSYVHVSAVEELLRSVNI